MTTPESRAGHRPSDSTAFVDLLIALGYEKKRFFVMSALGVVIGLAVRGDRLGTRPAFGDPDQVGIDQIEREIVNSQPSSPAQAAMCAISVSAIFAPSPVASLICPITRIIASLLFRAGFAATSSWPLHEPSAATSVARDIKR